MNKIGDVLLVLRRAADITQESLAEELGITQAALSRYENNLRDPDEAMLGKLALALGTTEGFLSHSFQMQGAIAADAHMRRQKTTKPSDWKRVEAQLNALRMHSSYLLDRVPMRAQNHVVPVDPDERTPSAAADLIRAAWRMPIGPVRHLVQWIESAGVIVVEEDFGTHRIDGMSQWSGEYPVIIVNNVLPVDRKRLTLAHELGHLVLHTDYVDVDVESQANEFAAQFLMPLHVISPQLRALTLGKLTDLKAEWGVSMQAIFERAFRSGKVSADERQNFYRHMNSRGWKTREPGGENIPPEVPSLAQSIGRRLLDGGLTEREINSLSGIQEGRPTPFLPPMRRLHAVGA